MNAYSSIRDHITLLKKSTLNKINLMVIKFNLNKRKIYNNKKKNVKKCMTVS
jgi:hypothetical protein